MIKTTLKIDGMMCGMCESHVNDCIRSKFNVKKVTSSHSKGETVIISEAPLDSEKLKEAIAYIPMEKILLETDSPYLAPVPLRGTLNTPVNVEHTYKFIAEIRGTTPEQLSNTVDENIKKLFNLTV